MLVGPLTWRKRRSLGATAQTAAAFDETMAIEHGMDGAFGGIGNAGESTEQALKNFPGAPSGVLAFHVQDKVFDLKREPVGEAIGAAASVG